MNTSSLSIYSSTEKSEELVFQGTSLSDGVAIGIVFLPKEKEEIEVPKFAITADQIDREIDRYRKAVALSRADLEHLQCSLAGEGLQEAVSIIRAHLEMLRDPVLTDEVEGKIRRELFNTESVFRTTMQEFLVQFSHKADAFFQQRLVDVMDISKRVLGHLRKDPKRALQEAPVNSVVVVDEIDASMTASVQTRCIVAFVTARGATGSHAALIARSRGIPYIGNIDIEPFHRAKGQLIIVDGTAGKVILSPKKETVIRYRKKQYRSMRMQEHFEPLLGLPAETSDGHQIALLANVGTIEEIAMLSKVGAEGIGLLRSELLFSDLIHDPLSEDAQFKLFTKAIFQLQGKPIVIRLFDFGGDKRIPGETSRNEEANPLLGCRGVRYLFRRPKMLRTHLRALLRAGVSGDLRLLVPMVSDLAEMRQIREIMEEVSEELSKEGIPHRIKLPIGCMLEVPSALLLTDALASVCDFFSLGTNDLTQYVLGIDRMNSNREVFYQPIHPGVLRLIRFAILEAKRHGRSISVCGEIASQPLFAPLLMGLGVNELSIIPRHLPMVKKMIRGSAVTEAVCVAREALACKEASQVYQLLMSTYSGSLENSS
ncbi:MAG: phosphoenolpyruvate--protein phosphotransferase [Simkania sp.]|nr:phosphoenolpyruvate--protein phosphotransferase [Simkania sp.]